MANSAPFSVFLDTSLDTHLAMVVFPDDTVASFKRKIVAEHIASFPSFGEIIVKAVKTSRRGVMYRLSDSMPVCAVFDGIEGTHLLFIEAVTPNDERTLGNKTEKKRHKRKVLFEEDTALRITRSRKGEEGFEGNSVQEERVEERGGILLKKKTEINAQASNSAGTSLLNDHGENQTSDDSHCDANASEAKKRGSRKRDRNETKDGDNFDERRRRKKVPEVPANGASVAVDEPEYIKEVAVCLEKEKDMFEKNFRQDSESPEIPDSANLMEPNISKPVEHLPTEKRTSSSDRGTEESPDPTNGSCGIAQPVKEKARQNKKDQSLLEVTEMIGAVVTQEKKKKRRKTKGLCSDLPSENEPQVADSNQVSEKEKDFEEPEKPGDDTCELEGSSGTSNSFVPIELVPLCKKKLLVLDINGLLADINSDYRYKQYADIMISGKLVFKRPFCDDFLDFCFTNFEIGVWSSRKKYNVEKAVDYLIGDLKNKLLFCWDQSKCTATNFNTIDNQCKPMVFKELKKLWDNEDPDLPWETARFTASNTLLVDDSPYKALCNPPYTAIFPYPYSFKHKEDNSLGKGGDLRVYLEKVARAEHVQHYVKENPFGQPAITDSHPAWNYYLHAMMLN